MKANALLARLKVDPRHDALDVVSRKFVATREFGSWSMRVKRAEPGTCSREFLSKMKREVQAISDPALQAMFIGFSLLGCRAFAS